jgi:protein TonB
MDLASAWVAGVAALFLLVGAVGSLTPLSPPLRLSFGEPGSAALVRVEELSAPFEAETAEPPTAEALQTPQPVEVSIPPLPQITPPLQPPEMFELQRPLEVPEPAPVQPPPEVRPPAPPPVPEAKPKPAPASSTSAKPASTSSRPGRPGGAPGASQPLPFSAAGGGSFPSPAYPSSARAARVQGTVVLLVTVESSGVPSTVEIRTSSGHTMLDTAARDHLRRNWRWPSGEPRLFLVPIKFVLQ